MNDILKKMLRVRGVKETQLKGEEKANFEQWKEVFAKEIKVEDIEKFLESQLRGLRTQIVMAAKDHDSHKSAFLAARIENFEVLKGFIGEPERSREALESQLEVLINKEHE